MSLTTFHAPCVWIGDYLWMVYLHKFYQPARQTESPVFVG